MPYANYQVHLQKNRERQKTVQGAANHLRANQAWRKRNFKKNRAHNLLNKAVLRGKLTPWPVCAVPECTKTKVHGHHADYDNPFGVLWLCDVHHKQAHAMAKETD